MVNNNGGIITATKVTRAGIPRLYLSLLVDSGTLFKAERGIYMLPDVWDDEMFFLQYLLKKGVFSHETSLYLHGLTDRTPINFTMTFPHGYKLDDSRKHQLIVKHVIKDNYTLGVSHLLSPNWNKVIVYDIERTLCDIVKTLHKADIQIVNQAMKTYAKSKNRDISKLIRYADQLRVQSKIQNYMEILL